MTRPASWRTTGPGREKPLRVEERPARSLRGTCSKRTGRSAGGVCHRVHAARRGRRRAGGRGRRDVPLQRRSQRGRRVQLSRPRQQRCERPAAPREDRRQPVLRWTARSGRQRRFLQVGEGPAEISVEHNTIVQTGNIITAYGGTRQAPSAADRFVFKDNIALHNANGVIGQGLAVGNDTLSKYFPGAAFYRNVLAGASPHAIRPTTRFRRWTGPGAVPERRRARLSAASGSSLRQSGSDSRDAGVSFTALTEALGAGAAALLGLPEAPVTPPERFRIERRAVLRPTSDRAAEVTGAEGKASAFCLRPFPPATSR